MTLHVKDPNIDLQKLFEANGVLTESGEDFHGLGKDYVRLRIPKDHEKLINAIGKIESCI
jgi:hypothetical protein